VRTGLFRIEFVTWAVEKAVSSSEEILKESLIFQSGGGVEWRVGASRSHKGKPAHESPCPVNYTTWTLVVHRCRMMQKMEEIVWDGLALRPTLQLTMISYVFRRGTKCSRLEFWSRDHRSWLKYFMVHLIPFRPVREQDCKGVIRIQICKFFTCPLCSFLFWMQIKFFAISKIYTMTLFSIIDLETIFITNL
jgi:hypothetical protein